MDNSEMYKLLNEKLNVILRNAVRTGGTDFKLLTRCIRRLMLRNSIVSPQWRGYLSPAIVKQYLRIFLNNGDLIMKKTIITLALFLASCTTQKSITVTFQPLIFDIKQRNTIAQNDTVKINFEDSGYSVKLLETTYNSRLIIQKLDTLIEVSK